jgi:hypothetical protein
MLRVATLEYLPATAANLKSLSLTERHPTARVIERSAGQDERARQVGRHPDLTTTTTPAPRAHETRVWYARQTKLGHSWQ